MNSTERFARPAAVLVGTLMVGLFGFGLSGCSSDPQGPPSESEPPKSAMRKLEAPPTSPPKVTANGFNIDPASFDWWNEGMPTSFRAAGKQEDVALQHLTAEDILDFRTNSTVLPRDATIAVFTASELDSNGIPTNDVGEEIDCLDPKSNVCFAYKDAEGVGFRLNLKNGTSIAVLHLSYFLLEGEAESTEGHILTGIWGIRLTN